MDFMRKRYLMVFSIILIILTLSVVSAVDADDFAADGADGILASVDDSVDLSGSVDDGADEILASVDDSVDLSGSVDDGADEILASVDDSEDDDILASGDYGGIIADDIISKTYVELNYYDLLSDNPHSVCVYDESDYIAIIHAPTGSGGTAHISVGETYDSAIEIFSIGVQELYKEVDDEDDYYTYYYVRPDDFLPSLLEMYELPDLLYVKAEYKRGLTSLSNYDEGYVNFVLDSDHVRVEAPPEIVIGDIYNSYIAIYVEGTLGNISVFIDGKKIIDDSVYNLRYINETDSWRYYIPVFLDSLPVGTHTYSVSYYGGNWADVTISDTIDVTYLFEVYQQKDGVDYGEESLFNDDYTVLYGDDVTFSILLPDDAMSAEIKVNGKAYEIFPINGFASLTLSDFELGENILDFTYNDPYYGEKSYSLSLQVNPLYIPSTVLSGSDDGIRLRLPSDAQGELKIYMWDDEEYKWVSIQNITAVNGEVNYPFDDFPWSIGRYDILVEFDDEKYYLMNKTSIEIVPNVHYDNISIGQTAWIDISLIGVKGNITLFVNGEKWDNKTLTYFGKALFMISSDNLNLGRNVFTLKYEGDDLENTTFYYFNPEKGEFLPYEYELFVEPVFSMPDTFSQNGAGTIIVDLPEGTSGNITVYVNDEAVSTTRVHGGENSIAVSGLSAGENIVKLVYVGDDGETYEIYRTVTISKPVPQMDIAIPKDSTIPQFTISLPSDATGTLYAIVDGEVYQSDLKNGKATITIPNLPNGAYNVKVHYTGDAKYGGFKDTVFIIINTDLKDPKLAIKVPSIYKGKKAVVTITTDKAFTGKVKVKIKSKTYVVNVVNGKGKLSISGLAVGTYTATATFAAKGLFKSSTKSVKFKVKANVIKLKLKKVKVKKSAKKLVIKATLRINGKLAKGKKLKFKFRKKVYRAKTNKKGVAKIVIKKKVLKKLKVGKKVKYQVSYGKKTVKRKVKVRK